MGPLSFNGGGGAQSIYSLLSKRMIDIHGFGVKARSGISFCSRLEVLDRDSLKRYCSEMKSMREMTIRLPDEYKPRLDALAARAGLKPAEFARQKLIEVIDQAERARHRAAMEEMVRQAIAYREIRDEKLEEAGLEAISEQRT